MDTVQVRLTKAGRELAGDGVVHIAEGQYEYEFAAGETKLVDRVKDWLNFLSKQKDNKGKPLFELLLAPEGVPILAKRDAALCPLCDNTGWRPLADDPKRRFTRCECRLQSRPASLADHAKIPLRFNDCEITNFRTDKRVKDGESRPLADARLFAREYVSKFPSEKGGLLIVGQTGSGKTHLAVGILKELIRTKAIRGLFCDYRELLRKLRTSMFASADGNGNDHLRPVVSCDVLVLDDLGASDASDWERDTVYYILNKRYSEAKTTIITTCLLDRPSHDFSGQGADSSDVAQESFEEARQAVGNNTIGDRLGDQVFTRIHQMCTKLDLQSRAVTLLDAARIPPRYENCELSNFETEFEDVGEQGHDTILANARFVAGRFVEDYPGHSMGLLLVGPHGTGKTHLAVGIVKELVREKNIPCRFCEYRELLREIKHSYNASVETTELDVLRPLEQIDVLVIDDIGLTHATTWQRDTIAYLISKRYHENRTTIITTSLPDEPTPKILFQDSTKVPSRLEQARMANRDKTLGEVVTDQVWWRLRETCKPVYLQTRNFLGRPPARRIRTVPSL